MKELRLKVCVKYPEGLTEIQRKIFAANLTVTWRALVEDALHGEFEIPLTETHKYIGDYAVTESDI